MQLNCVILKTKSKMTVRTGGCLSVFKLEIIKQDFAVVTLKMSNYKDTMAYLEIGQLIETSEPIEINLPGFNSKWQIIFFPKGQYEFGVASDDCRLYIKLIYCNKNVVKFHTKTFLLSSSTMRSSSFNKNITLHVNDKRRNWAGPIQLHSLNSDDYLNDELMIKLGIKIISNETTQNTFNSKRRLSEFDPSPTTVRDPSQFSPSKKNRTSPPPSVEDRDKNSSALIEDTSPMNVRNPFYNKSPLEYKKTALDCAIKSNIDQNLKKNENSVNDPPGKFISRQRRTMIFSPEERSVIQQQEKFSSSKIKSPPAYSKLTQDQSSNSANESSRNDPRSTSEQRPRMPLTQQSEFEGFSRFSLATRLSLQGTAHNQNFQTQSSNSSKCLDVSDILGNEQVDKEVMQAVSEENIEMNASETEVVRIHCVLNCKREFCTETLISSYQMTYYQSTRRVFNRESVSMKVTK